jgi:hypothetical protein
MEADSHRSSLGLDSIAAKPLDSLETENCLTLDLSD